MYEETQTNIKPGLEKNLGQIKKLREQASMPNEKQMGKMEGKDKITC